MNGDSYSVGGISLGWILTIVFIILKLTGVISWSWWWVFAPLWIPVVFVLAIVAIVGIVVLISRLFRKD